ncbi:MAG: MBL fold metallo-hydrolase [Spirochaetia bacterium]|nr:MBL fold metallo-hydrolase [Spirochaetia bacterium]
MKARLNVKLRTLSIVASILAVASCSSALRKDSFATIQVYRIDTGMANVYLIKGEKLIMVDTSIPGKQEFVVQKIQELGFKPEDIALIIVTHGHGDHAGSAKAFQEKYHIPIAGGQGDLDKFSSGKTDLGKAVSIGVMARLIRGMSDKPYPAFTPDIVVNKEMPLSKYGFENGSILPLAGHTPGSLVVKIGDVAFVGDLIRGGVVLNSSPTEHFYHENREMAKEKLKAFMQTGVRTFYPGHFGPLSATDVESYLSD